MPVVLDIASRPHLFCKMFYTLMTFTTGVCCMLCCVCLMTSNIKYFVFYFKRAQRFLSI